MAVASTSRSARVPSNEGTTHPTKQTEEATHRGGVAGPGESPRLEVLHETGGFTMAQATLIRPDGSGVFAEDTNQAALSVKQEVGIKESERTGKPALPPVVRTDPAVGTRALTNLVLAIAARTNS